MAIDPVCEMEVDGETSEWKSEYEGKTYYFCTPQCKTIFNLRPEKYVEIYKILYEE